MTKLAALLAVAGLRLQLLSMDFPEAGARVAEVAEALDGVMEQVRKLSRQLEPSPVRRTGLKNALLDLAEAFGGVTLRYTATAVLAPVAVDAVYRAIASVGRGGIGCSRSHAHCHLRLRVPVGDGAGRMEWPFARRGQGLGRRRAAGPPFRTELRNSGKARKTRQNKTNQGTIVVIQYAGRRPAGG